MSQLRAQDAPGHTPHDTTGGSAERPQKTAQERAHLCAGRRTRPATGKAAGRVCRGIDLLSHGGIGIKKDRCHCRGRSQKSRAPARAFGPVKLRPGDHFALAGLFSAWSPRSCGSAARLAQHGLTGKAHLFVDHIDGQRQLEPGKSGLPGHGGDKPAGRLAAQTGKAQARQFEGAVSGHTRNGRAAQQLLAGQAFVVQEHGDAACDGLIEGPGEVIGGLGKRRTQASHLVHTVVDGVLQVLFHCSGRILDLAAGLFQRIQLAGFKQCPHAALGIKVRLTPCLGESLVALSVRFERLVLFIDVPQDVEGGSPVALGIIKVDAHDLGGFVQIFLVGEDPQRGIRQGGQTFRLPLDERKLLDEGQRFGKAQSGVFGVTAHTGKDAGQILQLGVAQPSGHQHLVQQQLGGIEVGKIEFEDLAGHAHGAGQLLGAGPGHRQCGVDGLDGAHSLLPVHAGSDQRLKTGQQRFHRLAGLTGHIEQGASQAVGLLHAYARRLRNAHQALVQIGTVDDGPGRLVADAQARDAGGIATGQGLKAFPGLGGHAIEAAQAGTYLPGHARYGRRKGLGPGNEITAKIKREGGAQVRHDAILCFSRCDAGSYG